MVTEIIIGGAIVGAFVLILVSQLRKMLIAQGTDLSDLDSIIKNLLELEFNKEFFLKLALGTGLGIFGALVLFDTMVAGQPETASQWGLFVYGVGFGLAGNGILKLFTLVPEGFLGVLKLNSEVKALRAENQKLSTALNQNAEDQPLKK